MRANNGINGTGIAAMRAADAQGFIDDRNRWLRRGDERLDVSAKKIGKSPHRFFAARRAEVDCRAAVDNCCGIRATSGKAALSALCLRKQVIDLFDQGALVVGQFACGETER